MKKNITRAVATIVLCCALLIPVTKVFAAEDPPFFDSVQKTITTTK